MKSDKQKPRNAAVSDKPKAVRKFSPFDYVQKDLPAGRNIGPETYRYFDNFMVVAVMAGSEALLKTGFPRVMNDMYINRLPKKNLAMAYNTIKGARFNTQWVGVPKNAVYENEEVIFKVQAFFECSKEKALDYMSQGIYNIDDICEYYDVFLKDFSQD